MRVVVTGGRSYTNRDMVAGELWALYENDPDEFIVAHGRAAGPIRNRQMLEEFRPAIVLAFPGGAGTANCVKTARELGILVKEIS